ELEGHVEKGASVSEAVACVLPKVIKQHKRIIFNGNGYSPEWHKEAKRRGLLNLPNTVDALPQLVRKETLEVFERHKVLNARELKARCEVNYETYNKTINIEAQLMVLMANRYILPAALEYITQVGQSVTAARQAGVPTKQGKALLTRLVKLTDTLRTTADKLAKALEHAANDNGGADKHAKYFRDKVIPLMNQRRETGDALELAIPHELWPLPT